MANTRDQFISPADVARRLNVSVRALRLYEQRRQNLHDTRAADRRAVTTEAVLRSSTSGACHQAPAPRKITRKINAD